MSFDAQKLKQSEKEEILNGKYDNIELSLTRIEIVFPIFAEVNFKMVNFLESEYNWFVIQNAQFDISKINNNKYFFEFWAKSNTHPDPGFYQIYDSNLLKNNTKKYDPNNNYKLKHFLIVGYDSYIEIIGSENYMCKEIIAGDH